MMKDPMPWLWSLPRAYGPSTPAGAGQNLNRLNREQNQGTRQRMGIARSRASGSGRKDQGYRLGNLSDHDDQDFQRWQVAGTIVGGPFLLAAVPNDVGRMRLSGPILWREVPMSTGQR